jgi:tetraacyldisaccharide 4'-kinase
MKGRKVGIGCEVLLLTGIARPEPLKRELERRGAVVTLMQYADHHNFTSEELSVIARRFSALSSADKLIVTTEKDAERLMGRDDLPAIIKDNICALPIKVKIIDEENKFNQIIKDYVRENTGDRSISAVGDED